MRHLLSSGSWASIVIVAAVVGLWMFLFYALVYNVALLLQR